MQPGGSQYGVPPSDQLAQYAPSGTAGGARAQMLGISGSEPLAEAAPPISSRPPANFGDLGPGGSGVGGGFADDDALAAGEEAERGGASGNRWPRQETLALLKIRSEMDAAFRDATLKGPLWEDVSRKLAELGYTRSAKKCKEKFENVHKYYKRTKEGRAGRQDGKSYRFFSQLEALHSQHGSSSSAAAPMNTAAPSVVPAVPTTSLPPARIQQPSPISAAPPLPLTSAPSRAAPDLTPAAAAAAAGISFSSNTSSSSSEESDDEETEEGAGEGRKRKRGASGGGGSRKMMAFFEGLMKQVMERQESMQQRFLETIEKREQDRMIREEAWRRQEMARLSREHELMAQERAMAASRDAAVIAFLQKITGQTVPLPPAPAPAPAPPQQPSPQPPPPPPPQPLQSTPPPQKPPQHHVSGTPTDVARHQVSSSSELIVLPDAHETPGGSGGFEPGTSSSRWPKSEVHALIKIRSGLESRYQEAGPKGPLWEEISSEMQKIGYNRSSKRCKEKWENINKYFKKVKESNKKRPEDAKTCPYFHQLDALYRKKHLTGSASGSTSAVASGAGGGVAMLEAAPAPNPQDRSDVVLPIMPPPAAPSPQPESDTKPGSSGRSGSNAEGGGSSSNNNNNSGSNTANIQIQTSNGGLPPSFFDEGAGSGSTMKKPEDIMKELMEQQQNQAVMDDYDDKIEEPDSDNIDHDDDDDDDDDDEDRKLQYKIQFQRPNVGTGANNTSNSSAKTAATSAGSFLAMVQ